MSAQTLSSFSERGLSLAGQAEPEPMLSLSAAWKAVEGNRQLFRQAVSVILDDCPRLMESLETAAARSDVPAMRRAAHTLASSLRMFGLTDGAETAHQLQKIGTIEGPRAAELLADLRQECHQLQVLLANELRNRLRANTTATPDQPTSFEDTQFEGAQ